MLVQLEEKKTIDIDEWRAILVETLARVPLFLAGARRLTNNRKKKTKERCDLIRHMSFYCLSPSPNN